MKNDLEVCPDCGAKIVLGQSFCAQCGRRVTDEGTKLLRKSGQIGKYQAEDAPTQRGAYLEFLGGPEDGRIVLLSGERVTVGRREDNDVPIYRDSALSRRHAFIYSQEGQFWIEDRKSSFGTWVDNERVPVETAAPLRDGSVIRLARTTLLFSLRQPQEAKLRELVAQSES